jgi:hypothetical protein
MPPFLSFLISTWRKSGGLSLMRKGL